MTIAATLSLPLARLLLPEAFPRSYLAAVLRRALRRGSLSVTLPDGSQERIEAALPGPAAQIVVHRWRALYRLATSGGIGFAEAYVDGDWDSEDPSRVVELAACNREAMTGALAGGLLARLAARVRHLRNANTRTRSKRNVSAHYDLGNSFYALWLDPSMTYSSGIYPAKDATLEAAQEEKYRRMLDLLEATPGQRVLEIGCGWGGFACFAARRGIRVTGVTLSREQLDWASARVRAEGLDDRVDLRLADYRELTGRFDHIVSIEMIEAVGEAYWPQYFGRLRSLLAPGGRVALQVITIDDALFDEYRRDPDFIQTRVFPGGMLPSPAKLAEHATEAGFRIAANARYGEHYARTLGEWRTRYRTALPLVEALSFDRRFRRLWDFYLAYCEGGFRARTIDLHQVALVTNP
ncbi:MAG: class I SAM-dependent methyltransferase [Alphaproteobacteria bacterium]|nr:class I SAM-dependent methyltransferase [Alphaproteobacteria bacterium]